MQIQQNVLIKELLELTEDAISAIKAFKQLSVAELNYKRSSEEWGILECLEHLNLYGDFYLPEIEKQVLKGKPKQPTAFFKSGLIGNYFAKLMKVTNGTMKKMKSPKDKNPLHSALSAITIDRQLKQLEKLKVLLQQAETIDLTRTKTAISLTNLIRLRLGDTFRFVVYHNERHVLQAQRVLDEMVEKEKR